MEYLGDKSSSDEVQRVRTEIQRLQDLIAGVRDLATQTEVDELEREIERRESAYEVVGERLEELRHAGTRQDAVIEGAGPAWQNAMRADREERNEAFSRYASANNAHRAEAKAIEALVERRDELRSRM